MRCLVAVFTLFLLIAPPAEATETTAPLFGAQSFTLDNGLTVVVVENHRVPVVSHMVWYGVGAADEPPGKSGIAHMLEHMMFRGTENYAPGEMSRTISRHGGQENAFTSQDYTGYYQDIAVEHLGLVMSMEAERMRGITPTEEVFQAERDVVREERLQRVETVPASQLRERLMAALWTPHPYGLPTIGWMHEIEGYALQDVLDFHRRWYVPNNAFVILSGAVTLDQARTLTETHYGPIPRGPEIVRSRPAPYPQAAEVRVEMAHPRVDQPSWQRVIIAPGQNTADSPDQVYALQVLAEVLGGGASSRLYRSLVVEQGLAASAGAWYSDQALDHGTFGFWLTPRGDAPWQDGEAALLAEVQRLLTEGVSVDEVEQAKTRMKAGVIYARDSLQGAGRTLGATLATGGSLDSIEHWPAHIAAVTHEAVMAAARAVLTRPGATGVLLPLPAEEQG